MKLFLLVCLFSFVSGAACTDKQIEQARELYASAIIEKKQEIKIERLQRALDICYAPEIEANLLILQALQSTDVNTQVNYYKKALVSISKFENNTDIIAYQNQINHTISALLKQTNPQLSKIYDSKEIKEDNNSKKVSYLWVSILFGLLFLWGIYKSIKNTQGK